jgi:hypothetical protein
MITSKLNISIVVPYCDSCHGTFETAHFNSINDCDVVRRGFIVMDTIPIDEFYSPTILKSHERYARMVYRSYMTRLNNIILDSENQYQENQVNNNTNIIAKKYIKKYHHLDIVEKVYIQHNNPPYLYENTRIMCNHTEDSVDCECIATCIIKTHYIRLIQRKWKRLYREMMQRRLCPRNIRSREINGSWNRSEVRVLR